MIFGAALRGPYFEIVRVRLRPLLNYFAHNFIEIHRTLRISPAMAAGVTDRLWSVEDLVALWDSTSSG